MNSNLENTFLRLGYALRELKQLKNSTLILGAGCSLNSSTKDISTSGIMKSCLSEHGVENANDLEWEVLYKTFINVVWQGKGKTEQKLLLESKLNDVEPSSGHNYLRTLIENGYIHNIITTNFDMLLEKALEGLSYRKRVGINEYKTIGNNPIVDILKVHGDLEDGEFRFAPNELMRLPKSLQDEISRKTSGLLIFIGYRGQDIGLMNSINTSNSFATYWVDVNEPNMGDTYTTKHIFDFMSQRNSLNNFLHGNEFGNFHSIMKKLDTLLINPPHNMIIKSKEITVNNEWRNSSIVEMLIIYNRIYELFLDILEVSDRISSKHLKGLEDSEIYCELLHTYLYFFNSQKLPSELLHIPNNEVDALLLGTSIEVLVRTLCIGISAKNFVSELKLEIRNKHTDALVDNTFWDAIDKISSSGTVIDNNIKICFSKKLSLNSTNTPINALEEMLRTIKFLSLLLPVSEALINESNENYKIRQLLIGKSENINLTNEKITLNLGKIDDRLSDDFLSFCLHTLPTARKECQMISDSINHISIFSKWINIIYETTILNGGSYSNVLSIYSKIKEISDKTTELFKNSTYSFGMNLNEYVKLSVDEDLTDFIKSESSAIFIVGASGSGKTTALRNFVNSIAQNINVIVSLPKLTTMHMPSLSLFFDFDLSDINEVSFLSLLNTALKERNEMLVLILDGLNEINCKIEDQSYFYVYLVELAEKLFNNTCQNIKLIITCRERAYYQYRSCTSMQLNRMYFYQNKNYQKSIENNDYSYHIHSLNKKEKEELINKYINNAKETENLTFLLENIETTPFMIAAAATTLQSYPYVDVRNIYNCFTSAMLNKLMESEKYLARKVIYTYFDLILQHKFNNFEVTKFKIIDKLPLEYHDKLNDLIWQLIDINILSDDSRSIRFQHDKVEEFFFKEYIEENEYNGIAFFNDILELSYKNVIYQGGLLQYIQDLIKKKKLKMFKDIAISFFEQYFDTVSRIIVEALATANDLQSVLEYLITVNDSVDSTKFINLIIWGLDDCLQDYSIINFDFEDIIDKLLIISKNNYIVCEKKSNLYYLKSKIHYFKNDFLKSKDLANQALEFIDTSNVILLSQIKVHMSIIFMELGYSKKSIDSLEKEYELFVNTNDDNTFFNIAIELGRALNHSGQIDRTLELYQTLEKFIPRINNHYSLARFYEQKANVINRIMYDKLQYGFMKKNEITEEVRDEVYQLFIEAIDLYEKSMTILWEKNALWSYTGVVPEKINTYISYSYSIDEIGIQECKELIDNVDRMFFGFTTPFKTDFYLSKAYYYEYINDIHTAEVFILKALENAEFLCIKNKEAKCHEFYSQFAYRMILKKNVYHNNEQWLSIALEHITKAIDYFERFTLTENNIALKNAICLKEKLEEL